MLVPPAITAVTTPWATYTMVDADTVDVLVEAVIVTI